MEPTGSDIANIGQVLSGNKPIQVEVNLGLDALVKLFVLFIGALMITRREIFKELKFKNKIIESLRIRKRFCGICL